MKSLLDVEGIYNPLLRFAFTNTDDEEFRSAWDGQPIVVQVNQTIELPHHLGVKLTNELVDKLILKEANKDREANAKTPYYHSPIDATLGIPNARKVYEDKILRQLAVDEESPDIQVMRIQIREELKRDMERKEGVASEPIPVRVEEFAQLNNATPQPKVEKKPLKVKTLKTA